jgi:hypothetical protein
VVDVQLVGTGVMQILATHTAKGRALSVEGDRAGVVAIARRMVGELEHRAGMESESKPGTSATAHQESALRSADPAVRALVAMTGSQMRDDEGLRVGTVPGLQIEPGFVRTDIFGIGLNKLWGEAVHPLAAAAVAGALAGVLALIGILLVMEFGGSFGPLPSGNAAVLLVAVCIACSAIASGLMSGVMSFVQRPRVRQERKSDAGARRS